MNKPTTESLNEHEQIRHRLERDVDFLRAPEGYIRAGHPGFFTLFGRDSLIIAWQLLDFDPTIARDTLRVLADFQGAETNQEHEEEPGKILHEWWGDIATRTPAEKPEIPWPFPYYGSVDSTFLFLFLAARYYATTGDKALLGQLQPNILAAVAWIRTYADIDEDVFVEYVGKSPTGIYYQGWRDGTRADSAKWSQPLELVELQGYKYAAYTSIAPLLHVYDEDELAQALLSEAAGLQAAFEEKYYWPQERYFYFLFDAEDTPANIVTSNPGHLLFTGMLSEAHAQQVVARLFQPDIWTPYGIRTESLASPDFDPAEYQQGAVWPHDNWIIAEGLRISGFQEQYEQVKEGLLRAYTELGGIPELYGVDANNQLVAVKQSNPLQGWASAGLLNMLLR